MNSTFLGCRPLIEDIEQRSMIVSWQEIQLFHKGDEFFRELIACIRKAQHSITIETYIFEMDPLTDVILVELQLAIMRGCHVRLLVDGAGSIFWVEALKKRCQQEGIEFRVFRPFPRGLQWITRIPVALSKKTPGWMERVNRRNHRKVVLVDNQVAWLGSFNFSHVHSEVIMKLNAWRDSGVCLKGEPLEALRAAFDLAWTSSKRFPFIPRRPYARHKVKIISQWGHLLRLNVSDRLRRKLYKDLCQRILRSQKQICIVTPYFLPKRALAKALAKAARSGVHVRLIIPGRSDVFFVKWAASEFPQKLMKAGVQIYEYQPSILHAKYMIIDDWASIGSLNLNHRSLLHDLEVEAVLTDPDSLHNLDQQFAEDCLNSKVVDIKEYSLAPLWKRVFAKLLFKLRYWM